MKRIGLFIGIVAMMAVTPFVSAAEPLDDARIDIIARNCEQAQKTVERIRRSDAGTRINRGRVYEETIRLMAAFNSRTVLNTYNVPNLIEATTKFETEFTAFKATYIRYELSVDDTVKINCKQQPVTFYDALTRTRELRSTLAERIDGMENALKQYDTGMTELRAQIKSRSEARP